MVVEVVKTPTQILADQFRYRTMMGQRDYRVEEEDRLGKKSHIRHTLKLDIERARYVTQAYIQSDGEPMVIRRAKAMANYLDNMTIYITEHDRVVGNTARTPDHTISYPELYCRWVDKAIDAGYRNMVSDQEREEMHEINRYWLNKSIHGTERFFLAEEDKPYWSFMNHGVFVWVHGAHSGQMPNYEKLFTVGLNGILDETREKLREITADRDLIRDNPTEFLKKKAFLEAVIISVEAAIRWARRYAELARAMAADEGDAERRADLEEIAESCDWALANPPRTFRETLQCWFLVMLLVRVIDIQTVGIGDRIDYIWYPAYRKDKEEGRITPEEAQELIEHIWLKITELTDFNAPIMASGGHTTPRYVTIGGQDGLGRDSSNELTSIIMDSVKSLKLVEPMMVVRLHRNTPDEFLYRLTDILREDAGHYGIFNDEYMVPFLMSKGFSVEDARNWAVEDCMRHTVVGKPMGHRAIAGIGFVVLKCLELALSQGVDDKFFDGKQTGVRTADPLTFTSIEDVVQAYLEQLRFFTEKIVIFSNLTDAIEQQWLPQPFNSALLDRCIENAADVRDLHYWHKTNIQPVGHTTVVNALVAMKKLIFEDKSVTMAQLLRALADNWEGHEHLRRMFLDAPKFGNDDDYVDLFARDIHIRTAQTMQDFKTIYGHHVTCDGSGSASYFHFAGLTGATPDGRKDRETFNDGTVSPEIGTDKNGPTAVLRSVAKIDPMVTFNHLFNQRIAPEFLEGDNKARFVAYLRTFVDLGIHHIQFNVIDNEILRDAQKRPDQYQDLIVRVAGFSAYFVDMHAEVQNQIIARTRHRLS